VVLLLLAAGCAKDHAGKVTPPVASAAASASAAAPAHREDLGRLAQVEAGMSAEQVTALLGKPAEIRRDDGRRPWIVGASEAWAYGAAPDGFATGGLVLLDAAHQVLMTRSPIETLSVRARKLRWSDTAAVNDRGLSCHLEVLLADPTGFDARVTLRNDGASTFERRHGHTGIAFDLVVELFDEHRRMLARYDTLSSFSPYAPDDTVLMSIPAGGALGERVRLGAPTWSELGKLPAGGYLVRVAFPFEVGKFSVSEPVSVRLGG
jgi:hypothetical protein